MANSSSLAANAQSQTVGGTYLSRMGKAEMRRANGLHADAEKKSAEHSKPGSDRDSVVWLWLKPLSQPIAFIDCPEIAALFISITRGWSPRFSAPQAGIEPLLSLSPSTEGYVWASHLAAIPKTWSERPPQTAFDAVLDIHYELSAWFLRERPKQLCLHCAGVLFPGGLTGFPNPGRAGKSSLVVHLAAHGYRVFCDDVLPVEDGSNCGIAWGLLPRLRMPLARQIGTRLREFVETCGGPAAPGHQYVNLPEHVFAPLGEQAAITRLVLLDRVQRGEARLQPVSSGEMLKTMISQNFAHRVEAPDIFDRLFSVVQGAECIRLTYATGPSAVKMLAQAFGRPLSTGASA